MFDYQPGAKEKIFGCPWPDSVKIVPPGKTEAGEGCLISLGGRGVPAYLTTCFTTFASIVVSRPTSRYSASAGLSWPQHGV